MSGVPHRYIIFGGATSCKFTGDIYVSGVPFCPVPLAAIFGVYASVLNRVRGGLRLPRRIVTHLQSLGMATTYIADKDDKGRVRSRKSCLARRLRVT